MLRRKAKGDRHLEFLERAHLPIKPGIGIGPKAIRPTKPGAQMADAKLAEQADRVVQSMILEVKPLADAKVRSELRENLRGAFWRAVFPENAHVEMAIVTRSLGLPDGGWWRARRGEDRRANTSECAARGR